MKTSISNIVVAAAAALAASATFAQASAPAVTADQATGQKESTFTILDRLNTENVVLNAQIENAKLKKKLNDVLAGKDTDNAAGNSAPVGSFPQPMTMAPQNTAPAIAAEPKGPSVQFVFTSPKVNGGRPTATIALANGRTVDADVGTKVPGVGTITAVSAQQVLYRGANGREAALPFIASGDDSGSR